MLGKPFRLVELLAISGMRQFWRPASNSGIAKSVFRLIEHCLSDQI